MPKWTVVMCLLRRLNVVNVTGHLSSEHSYLVGVGLCFVRIWLRNPLYPLYVAAQSAQPYGFSSVCTDWWVRTCSRDLKHCRQVGHSWRRLMASAVCMLVWWRFKPLLWAQLYAHWVHLCVPGIAKNWWLARLVLYIFKTVGLPNSLICDYACCYILVCLYLLVK